MPDSKTTFYSFKNLITTTVISAVYLGLCGLLIGFKTEQFVLAGIFNLLYYLTKGTRKFILGFSVFIVFWILFDFMKAFPNYRFHSVHVEDIYSLDKNWFGFAINDHRVSWNEYFYAHSKLFLDVLSGFFYLCWMPVPLLFGMYLFYTKRPAYIHFALSFLWVNLIGFVIYYICPSAPPWYIRLHGFVFNAYTPGNTTLALANFDSYFGVRIFHGLYAQSSNVFAAMPSLHASYPTIVFYWAVKNRKRWYALIFFGLVMLGIWFAAVYTGHHYVIDVIAGIACAAVGLWSYQFLYRRATGVQKFVNVYIRKVSFGV